MSLDRTKLLDAARNIDTEAERLTDLMQAVVVTRSVLLRAVERRAKLWRAAKLLRELVEP